MKCDNCNRDAITFIRYNGAHLCEEHFVKYFEKRVKREIRKQINLYPGDKVAVAVSGGKDSMVTLRMLHETFRDRKDIEVHALSCDEGAKGYRSNCIKIVKEYCEKEYIPFHVVTFEEYFGMNMDEIAPVSNENSPCTYCGVLRRKCLNTLAKEIGAKYLATGHNLDDMSQSIMMNFVRGDIERLARLGPHTKVQPGLIPRFHPLRMIPEKESLLYAMVTGMKFYAEPCPYRGEALRNQYREIVDDLEMRSPGSKFSILSSYDQLKSFLDKGVEPAELGKCQCGEPTMGKRCKACEYETVLKKRIGPS